jgi:hypothetical protein
MSDTLKQTAPLAILALLCRLVLALWPVEAVSTSQSALLAWPAFLVAIFLSPPAVYVARRWSTRSEVTQVRPSPALVLKALALGALLALPLIGWDMLFRLPRDLHIPGPQAVPFYIAGAFLVEVVQHVIPLALWLGLVGRLLLRDRYRRGVFWTGALLIAAFEPLSILGGPLLAGYTPAFYVLGAVVIYAINLVQLLAFRRYGFTSMLAIRLGMYALWHIIWGALRLQILF